MIDLTVGVILGTATGAVVNGFVADIAMSFIGHFKGGVDISELKYVLDEAVVGSGGAIVTPENTIKYGSWINTIIKLIAVGFVLF